ncbi:hypothetical protein HPB49_018627 [Dermacentor silvarum]|uniref:Uncharacterized protein n=1 Tax=Dermacentor silvarum TaxID=543639 RepID=A0ACB8DF66_DERSI|nr:hypothetical protein HPB49_018627 [Dermacentor silvarum]
MAFMGKFSKCPLCHKEFSTSGSLSKHKRRVHKVMPDPTRAARAGREVRCGEQDCTYVATRRDDMRDHLVVEHGLSLVEVQEEFESMKDFREWMDLVSRANRTQFAARASDTQARATVHRYVCHRSGLSNLKTTARRRRIKSQGSCKMGSWCTAYLNARECLLTGAVRVNGCLTHYGHDMDVVHLRISAADRRAILAEIRRGVPFDRILENIRSDFPQDAREITRMHLITMGDIRNIAVSEGLLSWKLDVDDDRSVRKLAARFAAQSYSPILLYKSRGTPADAPAEADATAIGSFRGLAEDDIALVIQTRYQRDLVSRDPALVCVEPVTGHSSEYTLLALLATTDAGLVVPIAWCVCGAANPAVVAAFFQVVHQNMGDFTPRFFMSEDTEFYFNAWLEAFGAEPRPHKESVESFQKMLRRVINMLKMDSDTASFGDVFESTYAGRPEQWGSCFFRDLDINIEDFHTLFRRIASRLKVKRLDKIAHNLLLASESKQYENYMKVVRQTQPDAESSKKQKAAPLLNELIHSADGVPVEVVSIDTMDIAETVSIDTVTYEAMTTGGMPVQVMPVEEVQVHELQSDDPQIETICIEEVQVETLPKPKVPLDAPNLSGREQPPLKPKRPGRKSTHQMALKILEAHQEALNMSPEHIVHVTDNQWKVIDEGVPYDVIEVLGCCKANCQPRCSQCSACSHRYNCSCGCTYMCRHIHACLIHASEVFTEPVGMAEEVVNTMTPEALAESTSFAFSSIEPTEEAAMQGDKKKLEVLCALHKLNETCVRAAEILATREDLPVTHQADYILSTLKATSTVLDTFCRRGMTQTPRKLADHDYESTN